MNKVLFYILLSITCMLLLTTCTPSVKQLVKHNQPIVTKKGRWVPGNAKRFQQRHDAKLKRQIQKDSANKKLQP